MEKECILMLTEKYKKDFAKIIECIEKVYTNKLT
jgi:hypothetical protein